LGGCPILKIVIEVKDKLGQTYDLIEIREICFAKSLEHSKINTPRYYMMRNRLPNKRPRSMWHYMRTKIYIEEYELS